MAEMEKLESQGFLEPWDAIVLMAYTSNFGGTALPLSNALSYCQTHFPSIEACTGAALPAGNAGVPWGMVVDLGTMEVLGMEGNSGYITFLPANVYNAIKAAHDN
jgi:hypothetical protein